MRCLGIISPQEWRLFSSELPGITLLVYFWESVELCPLGRPCAFLCLLPVYMCWFPERGESGALACFPMRRSRCTWQFSFLFCCCGELPWQNAALFQLAVLGYSPSLWRTQDMNFKQSVVSHPPSGAESNGWMHDRLLVLSSFPLLLLSSRPLTQGIVPPLETISQYSLLIAQWYSVICTFHISFIHSLVGKHLGSFQFVWRRLLHADTHIFYVPVCLVDGTEWTC